MAASMRRDSPWLALVLLTAISTVGFIDRIVMNVLAVPIQAEFQLSDTQVGLLTGLAFAVLVLVPVSVYFYAFHGDWFLLYAIDVKRIPSALAMVGFALEVGLGAVGFGLGSVLVRAQRETLAAGLTALLVLLAGAVVPAAGDRLRVVGTYAQFRGGFGLVPFLEGPLFTGALAMGGFFALGALVLLGRLWAGSRKG